MSADDRPVTDVGPATPAPNWCLPGTEPDWQRLTGGGAVCAWERKVSDDVWVECEDRVVDGRVMRTAPRIQYFEPTRDGITCAQAHELAAGLIAAADVLACAAIDEAAG